MAGPFSYKYAALLWLSQFWEQQNGEFRKRSDMFEFRSARPRSCRHVSSLIMLKYRGHIESNCAIWATILFQLHSANSNKYYCMFLSASIVICCLLSLGQHVVLLGIGHESQPLGRQFFFIHVVCNYQKRNPLIITSLNLDITTQKMHAAKWNKRDRINIKGQQGWEIIWM